MGEGEVVVGGIVVDGGGRVSEIGIAGERQGFCVDRSRRSPGNVDEKRVKGGRWSREGGLHIPNKEVEDVQKQVYGKCGSETIDKMNFNVGRRGGQGKGLRGTGRKRGL